MRAIKQKGKTECVACVACMATNTRLVDFERFFFTKGPPFSDSDFYRYLLAHGLAVGIGFENKDGQKFSPEDKIRIEFSLKDFPAYVVVKSMRFKGMTHVVYWDGEKILDPNPNIKEDGLPLEKYEIISWFPIVKFYMGVEMFNFPKLKEKSKEER